MSTAKASGAALVSPTWRQNRRPIRLIIPTPIRQARPTGGDSPPGSPADSSSVRELLRGFGCTRGGSGGGDDGGLGEDGADGKCGSGAFGANRLVKLTVLGKGSTSTVWKAVDVDTLRVVAVKEMVVCDSKQRSVLEHELRVLNSQHRPLSSGSSGSGGDGVGSISGGDGGGPALPDCWRRESQKPKQEAFCPYIPKYHGTFLSEDAGGCTRVSIVMEHLSGGDLGRWIDEQGARRNNTSIPSSSCSSTLASTSLSLSQATGGVEVTTAGSETTPPYSLLPPPSEAWLARVCRDTLEALRHLHARHCIHRDVKPSNVLLGPGGAKLADFGSTVEDGEGAGHRMHGTIRFMSPERLWAQQCCPRSDLWSAGLTVASAALGENPIPHCATEFEAVGHAETAFEIVSGHPSAARLSHALMDFLKKVLVANPEERPTVDQMLRHPFVLGAETGDGGVCGGGHGLAGGVGQNPCCSRNWPFPAIVDAEKVVRQIVSARRERRRLAGKLSKSCSGSGSGVASGSRSVRYTTTIDIEQDIAHLAMELEISGGALRSLFVRTEAELDLADFQASEAASHSPSLPIPPPSSGTIPVVSTEQELDASPAPSQAQGMPGSEPSTATVSAAAAGKGSTVVAGAGGRVGGVSTVAAAAVAAATSPVRTRFINWRRGREEKNRHRASVGREGACAVDTTDCGRSSNRVTSVATFEPTTGTATTVVPCTSGWWKSWTQGRRVRATTTVRKYTETQLPSPRYDASNSPSSSRECKTRPPSGQEDAVVLMDGAVMTPMSASPGAVTGRRRGKNEGGRDLVISASAGNLGKPGVGVGVGANGNGDIGSGSGFNPLGDGEVDVGLGVLAQEVHRRDGSRDAVGGAAAATARARGGVESARAMEMAAIA